MRGFKFILATAMAACIALSGCENSTSSEDLLGVWEIDSAKFGNASESLTTKEINQLKEAGHNIIIQLKENGTYRYDFLGEVVEGEWSETSEESISMDLGGEAITLSLKGDKLRFDQNDQVFYFIKSNATIGSGIGGASPNNDDEKNTSDANTLEQSMAGAAWVISDSDMCSFLIYSEELDEMGNPGYSIRIVNNHISPIEVSAEAGSFTVNGMPAEIELNETIQAGEYVETGMYFKADEIGGGLEKLLEVSGVIVVADLQTSEILDRFPFLM